MSASLFGCLHITPLKSLLMVMINVGCCFARLVKSSLLTLLDEGQTVRRFTLTVKNESNITTETKDIHPLASECTWRWHEMDDEFESLLACDRWKHNTGRGQQLTHSPFTFSLHGREERRQLIHSSQSYVHGRDTLRTQAHTHT